MSLYNLLEHNDFSNEISEIFAVDLDGTLLHSEPESVPVWGRSGYRYMSHVSAKLLEKIGKSIPIVIATGRNAQSVQRLVNQLPNVRFYGFVLENGLVTRTDLHNNQDVFKDEWADVMPYLFGWERLSGYERCLGLIPPAFVQNPESVLKNAMSDTGKNGCLCRDRHKLFVYPSNPSKLSGIRSLMAKPLIALGNECNDLDMLEFSKYSASIDTAHEQVKQLIRQKNGYCSILSSHAASEDILRWVKKIADTIYKSDTYLLP